MPPNSMEDTAPSPEEQLEQAYNDGYEALYDGYGLHTNPHGDCSTLGMAWERGYLRAAQIRNDAHRAQGY